MLLQSEKSEELPRYISCLTKYLFLFYNSDNNNIKKYKYTQSIFIKTNSESLECLWGYSLGFLEWTWLKVVTYWSQTDNVIYILHKIVSVQSWGQM